MATTITKLRQLRNLGIFADHAHSASTPALLRYNLVYGFNGSGKTTLSRIFQSVGAERLSQHLPANGELTLELSDGTLIKADSLKCDLSPRIAVFNHDFVHENLVWTSGTARPVFYIGTAQGNALKLLQRLEKRTGIRHQVLAAAEKESRARDRELASFKTETGKLVAEELNLGRRYNATNVETDYGVFDAATAQELSEDERKAKKALINREAPAQDILFQRPAVFASAATIRRALEVASRSLGGVMIAALEQHPSMTGWVKAGLDYHVEHALSDCLHCGQPLTAERIAALQASFDDAFEVHVADIGQSRTDLAALVEALRNISDALPLGELPADLVGRFKSARVDLQVAGKRCHAFLRALRSSLEEKAAAPNAAVLPTLPETIDTIDEIDQAIEGALAAIAKVVEEHNLRNSRFAAEQDEARTALKRHHLREGQARYVELRDAAEISGRDRDVRQRLADTLSRRVVEVRDKLRSHGPAVETVNSLLKSFLGHGELALAADGEGYRIQRRGKNATGPLSEGEKTAVAFCYYLTKLEEDGRRKKDVIAVVDDPISSLDTKALNYAFSLLKRTLADTAQLIVLTHNMDFMNEAKKWLKGKAYPRNAAKAPEASLLFIATTVSPCGTQRSSSLCELPVLLREYDSEYQYLFSLVFLYSEGRADDFAYLMPNVMRKVLEVFLAFKCPGSSGVESKLEQGVVKGSGVNAASLAALARLCSVESHGDSLDDLVKLPVMTIEESKGAAASLFQLIEALDPEHYKGMTALSRRANPAPGAPAYAEVTANKEALPNVDVVAAALEVSEPIVVTAPQPTEIPPSA
jgi:wobble nucleotide-excising tRNase